MSYHDSTNVAIKVARFDGTSWQRDFVDTDSWGLITLATSIAFDAFDQAAIAYEGPSRELRYATFDGSAWTVERPGAVLTSFGTVIMRDAADRALIAYGTQVVGEPPRLWLASSGGGPFTHERIARDERALLPDIVADLVGRATAVHIIDDIPADLFAYHLDGLDWTRTVVGTVVKEPGMSIDLALERTTPMVSFSDGSTGELRLDRFDGRDWVTEIVASSGSSPGITFDSSGYPAISYIDNPAYFLKWTRYDGSRWLRDDIRPLSFGGGETSIVLDPAGNAWVGLGFGDGVWMYREDEGWSVVHAAPYVYDRPIVGAPWGEPVIPIRTGLDAAYRRWNAVAREWETVLFEVPRPVVSEFVALQYDSRGQPVVAFESTDQRYLLARTDGSTWRMETICKCDDIAVLREMRLTLDADDEAYLALRVRRATPGIDAVVVARTGGRAVLYRAALDDLQPGWKRAALPLTAINDDQTAPFPATTAVPGTTTEAVPLAGRLTLYRVLWSDGRPARNTVRAVADASTGTVEIHY